MFDSGAVGLLCALALVVGVLTGLYFGMGGSTAGASEVDRGSDSSEPPAR